MNIEMKPTGYPSIDKPWEIFYRKMPVRKIDIEQTMYNLVFGQNIGNMNIPAISYMGKTWSFAEIKEKVDKAASAFVRAGLCVGDVVLIGLPNIPEAIICLLALNKIGVVSKWVDVRAGENDVVEYLIESNCSYAIVLDILLPIMKKVIEKIDLKKVWVISPVDSLAKGIQVGYRVKNPLPEIKERKEFQRFTDFINEFKEVIDTKPIKFDKDRPTIMIQSSGTTGKPKAIIHTDYSATSAVSKLSYSDLPLGEGKVLLNVLPPWIAYAIGEAILYPLALGTRVILHPTVEDETLIKYLGEFTIAMAVPLHYRYLYHNFENISQKKTKKFLNTVECLVSGGDKLSIEENKAFEDKFGVPVVNGWGNNEGWGCLAVNPVNYNRYGSVGIPKRGETIIAYDNDSKEEKKYNEVGEICVLADTMFLRYEGNETETNTVKQVHKDGKEWMHTGDLGYIDENGFVFLAGRLRRVITRKGFKISAYTIEDALSRYKNVKECVAVEVHDLEEGTTPMAFIVLKEPNTAVEEIRKGIIEYLRKELKSYEIPKYIHFVKELPYTQNSKYDFRMLESWGNEMVQNMNKVLE